MQIKNNVSALFVTRQMEKAHHGLNKSTERLASGMRINRGGDDATNLAVSEKMRTQIRGLRQAERNAMTGMSFIQVAEGNLGQVNDILQRIRELSVQAANGIYSEGDRQQIQVEISQLIDEVDRISTTAQFNQRRLLTGDLARNSKTGSIFFHVGPNQNQRIRAFIATMNSMAFGLTEGDTKRSLETVGEANQMIGTVDEGIDRINRQRADLGGYYNRMQVTSEALRIGYENMVAAESQIRDTDMAEELVEFTKNQIMLQSSTAMLAQANFSSSLVLNILDNI